MQLPLFPVVPPQDARWPYCIHGVLITFTVGECPQCQTYVPEK